MGELFMMGLNHRAAPLEVRERLAFSLDRIPAVLKSFRGGESVPGGVPILSSGDEAVLLSTCNRSEIYIYTDNSHLDEGGLQCFLSDCARMPSSELGRLVYRLRKKEAAHHLLQVAAGLDSLLVGENEILGQVKDACEIAHSAGSTGPILSALFRFAARAGKRVRTETEIGRVRLSTADVVVELAEGMLGPLAERRALLIGAGKISSTTARSLVRAGLRCILVANRTFERAQKLAASLGEGYAKALNFDALDRSLAVADIVICSTGAPHFILHPSVIETAMAARPERPLLIADLSVPRDVDPAAAAVSNVTLVDMDGLDGLVRKHHPLAAAARQAAENIVVEELEAFLSWWAARSRAPLIHALQDRARAICQEQVEQTSRRMGDLTPQQKQALEAMGQAVINKLLHDPIEFLHETRPGGSPTEAEEVFRRMFGLH